MAIFAVATPTKLSALSGRVHGRMNPYQRVRLCVRVKKTKKANLRAWRERGVETGRGCLRALSMPQSTFYAMSIVQVASEHFLCLEHFSRPRPLSLPSALYPNPA